jgi:hypothetical protein
MTKAEDTMTRPLQPARARFGTPGVAASLGIALLAGSGLADAKVDANWVLHRDRAGFSLQKPADWRVQSGSGGDIAVTDPRGTAAALIRARVVPARVDLVQWLQRHYAATEPGLHNVRILKADGRGAQVAHAAFDYGSNVFQGRASVIAVRHGDMATVFVAAAARTDFAQRLPELTRILDSLRFGRVDGDRGGSAPPQPRVLPYARWTDPYEQAFSADLPAGWRHEGGLRRSTWNVRLAFTSTSPDGAMQLFSGDMTLPRMFIEPNATILSLGYREAQVFGQGGSDGQTIRRFQSAQSLGAQLVRSRFGAQVTATRQRSDLTEIARRNPLLQRGPAAATAADVEFAMRDGRVGVLTLTTFGGSGSAGAAVGSTWWADGVHGFIAPPDQVATAAAAMARMLVSARENPQWAAGEADHQRRMSQQYQSYLRWSQDLQQKTIAQRWQADEARQRGVRDVLGATVRLHDPTTGETFEASAQDRYYFRVKGADRPTAIGSDTDFKPVRDVDLTRLLAIGTEVPDR